MAGCSTWSAGSTPRGAVGLRRTDSEQAEHGVGAGNDEVGLAEAAPEPVKHFETPDYDAFCPGSSLCSIGSLIQATLGSAGGSGGRWRNLAGLVA